jgi:hypothetical protein
MRPQNVELHIEELVLRGFAPGERHRIGEAVERELVRLLDEHGVPPSLAQGIEVERLDGGAFEVSHGSKLETVGVQVAQAIYGGLS